MTIVCFWNVNMGNGNVFSACLRRATFRRWVQWATPDILFLEELSATLLPGRTGVLAAHDGIAAGATIAGISGMTYLNHVETLQEGSHPASTKNIVALRSTALVGGNAIAARPLRMGSSTGLETERMRAATERARVRGVRGRSLTGLHVQPRMCLKLTNVPATLGGGKFEVIGVHAKSGGGGRGRQAVAWALGYVDRASGRNTVIGGDFNYDFNAIGFRGFQAGVTPLLHGGVPAGFTQWSKAAGYHPANQLNALALPLYQGPSFTVQPHGVIDYVVYNSYNMVIGLNSVPAPALGVGCGKLAVARHPARLRPHASVVQCDLRVCQGHRGRSGSSSERGTNRLPW